MNARAQWLIQERLSAEEARGIIPAALSPEEARAAEGPETHAPDVLPVSLALMAAVLERREREVRALQAAWEERAAVHEALTRAGVPAGDLAQRVAWLIRQWRKDGAP